MSDQPNNSERQSAENQPSGAQQPFVAIPVELVRYVRSLKLTGTQYDLWLYLYELDPFGDRWVEVPPPDEIAIILKVDPRTVERAARRLDDCKLFEFQIKRWKARNTTVSAKVTENSTGKEIRKWTKRSKSPQMDQFVANGINLSFSRQRDPNVTPEPAQGATSSLSHTIHTDQTLSYSERETFGTEQYASELSPFFELTRDGSLKLLAGYEKWLKNKAQNLPVPPTLIEQWIESESQKEANQRQFLQEQHSINGANVPPTVPDRFQIETACVQAALSGDRAWVLERLQQLWGDGWHELVEDLVQLYPDWSFELTDEGVRDAI